MRLLILFLLLIPVTVKTQIHINGKVVDEFGFVVSDVFVYADNTSRSVYSDSDGTFSFHLPEGQFTLVFRKEGYYNKSIPVDSRTPFLEVILQSSETVILDEAVITPGFDKDWQEHFNLFKESFLGLTKASKDCEILNPKVLKFKFDKDKNLFTGRATKPLIIENKYLGYKIEYDLTEFFIDYKNQNSYTEGTSFFVELNSSKAKKKKWIKHRKESFEGSILHFIRALYNHNLNEEGFIVYRLIENENPEYTKF